MSDRQFPDEPAGTFPTPPRTAADATGRRLRYLAVGESVAPTEARSGLLEMYREFDPADRAQGIPPAGESALEDWLSNVLGGDSRNVLAVSEASGATVGHATLVPDGTAHELAIFVLQPHQGVGIGTELIRTALGYGAATGVDRVWLTVERWNAAAVALYEKTGFETNDAGEFQLEMCLRLD